MKAKHIFKTLTGWGQLKPQAKCELHGCQCVEVKHIPHSGIGTDRYCVSKCITLTDADAFNQTDAEAFSAKVDALMQGRAA